MDCQSLDLSGKWFMDPKEDKTIDAKKVHMYLCLAITPSAFLDFR